MASRVTYDIDYILRFIQKINQNTQINALVNAFDTNNINEMNELINRLHLVVIDNKETLPENVLNELDGISSNIQELFLRMFNFKPELQFRLETDAEDVLK